MGKTYEEKEKREKFISSHEWRSVKKEIYGKSFREAVSG